MSETLVSQPRHNGFQNPGMGRHSGPYDQNGGPYPQNGASYPQNGAQHETPARMIVQKKSEITVADSNPMAAHKGAGGASNVGHVVSPKTAANIKEMVDGGADIPDSMLYANDTHMRTAHVAAHAGPTSNALLAGRRHAPIAHAPVTHQRKPSEDSLISDISSNSKLTVDRNSGSPNQPYSVPEAARGAGGREGVALKNGHNNGYNGDYSRQSGPQTSPRDRPPIGGGGPPPAAPPLSPSYVQLERQAANKQSNGVRGDPSQQPPPPVPYYQQSAQYQTNPQALPHPSQSHHSGQGHHRLQLETASTASSVDYQQARQAAAGGGAQGASPYQTYPSPGPPSSGYYPVSPQSQSSPHGSDQLPRPSGQSRRSQRRNSDSDSVTSEASSIKSGHSGAARYPPAYNQQQHQLQQQGGYHSPPSHHAQQQQQQQQQQQPYPTDHLPRPSGRSSGTSSGRPGHVRRPSDADSVASDTSSLRSGGQMHHHPPPHHPHQQQPYPHQQYPNGYHPQQQHQPQPYYDDRAHHGHPPHQGHPQYAPQYQQQQTYQSYHDRPLPNPYHNQQQQAPHSRAAPPPQAAAVPRDDVPRNSLGQRLNPEYRSLAVRGSPSLHQNEEVETDDDEYMSAHDLRRASGKLDFANVYDPNAKETPLPAERPAVALDLMPLRERVMNQRPQGPAVNNERLQQDDSEKRHDWNRHNTVSISKIYGHAGGEEDDHIEGMPEEGFSDKADSARHYKQQQQQQPHHRHGPDNGSNLSQTTAESVSDRAPAPQKDNTNGKTTSEAAAAPAAVASTVSSEKASNLCEYEPPPALSNITKAQQSREVLYSVLKKGLTIIKHGRYGAPKKKILTCDQDCDHLYWRDDNGLPVDPKYHASLQDSKGLKLSDVKQIRMGGEIDPTSIPEDYAPKRKTLTETLFGHHKDEGIKYGTATLRKHCKEADLLVSFSLIMNDRTFDIQCLSKKDYNLLYSNLYNIINDDHSFALLPKTMPPLPKLTAKSSILITSPAKTEQRESRKGGRRKSVTFSDGQAAASIKEGETEESSGAGAAAQQNTSSSTGPETYSDKVAAAATAAVDRQMSNRSFESESDKFNASFSANEAVYELDDSDNYDLLLQPLANYSKAGVASTAKKDTFHPAAMKGAGGPSGATNQYKGYKEYNKFLAELHDDYDDDSDDQDEHRRESKRKTEMHTLLNSSQERIVISSGLNSRSSSPGGSGDGAAGITRISSNEAMEIGLLLSQQEALYGINMYDSLKTTDAPELDRLMREQGLTTEKALLEIFNKRFDPRHQGLINMQNRGDMGMAPIATALPVYNNKAYGGPVTPPHMQQMGGGNNRTLHRMTSNEALMIGLMLSKQEAEYGTNMYESLTAADDAEISRLCRQQGFSEDEAVLEVFNRKFVANYRGGRPGSSPFSQQQQSHQNSYATAEAVPFQQGRDSSTPAGYGSPVTALESSPANGGMRNPRNTKAGAIHRMNSTDGMNLMLLISQQEAEHGTNMYDSMVPSDEAAIMEMMETGRYSHEQAVQALFEKRYRSRPGGIAINSPPRVQQRQQQQAPSPMADFSYLPPPPMGANSNWQNESYNSNYSFSSGQPVNGGGAGGGSVVRARSIQRIQSTLDSSASGSGRTPQFFSPDVPYYGSPNSNNNNGAASAQRTPPPLNPHSNSKMSGGSGRKGPREDHLTPEATAVHSSSNSKRSSSPVVAVPASPGVPVVERKRSIFSLNKQKSGIPDGSGEKSVSVQYREKDVRQIMALGYVREQAVSALVETNNNLQRAIQLLAGS